MATRPCLALAGVVLTASLVLAEEAVVKALAIDAVEGGGVLVAEVESNDGEVRVEVVPLPNAAGAMQVFVAPQRSGNVSVFGVREKVDREDPLERFALLTSGGPIVVEAEITLHGKPFRVAREELIDKMLSSSDKDNDMKVTWEEALGSPWFSFGRVRILNDQQRNNYIKMFDADKNGMVERPEARLFVAQYFQGPAFSMSAGYGGYASGGFVLVPRAGGYGYARSGGQADVVKLLDVDKDGGLDEKEIATASDRLKSRDADDNDLLYPNELTDAAAANNGGRQLRVNTGGARPQIVPTSVLLGPAADAELLFKSLQVKYNNDEGHVTAKSFRAVPALFEQLDENKNGRLEQSELLTLNDVKPQLELNVTLGKSENKGLKVKSIADELKKSKESAEAVTAELPGIKLNFAANLAEPRAYNYSAVATRYMQQYDKNKNEYLEKDELPGGFARNFELWDADQDGKVFAKEITATYDRQQAPMRTQVRASAASQGNSLFQALDTSGDGRLSLREMMIADERLATFDKNKDGRIAGEEIPVTISVTFSQGAGYGGEYTRLGGRGGARPGGSPSRNSNPDWFTRMDRNGDGDVTLKEFLGGEENFKKLDTNNDGFIEPKEAKAASN